MNRLNDSNSHFVSKIRFLALEAGADFNRRICFFIRSFKYRQSAQRLSKLSVQFKNSPSRGRFISELEIDFLHYSPVRIWKQIKKDGQILFQTDHPVEPELYLDG